MAEENLREFIREIFSKDYEVTKESITSLTKPGDNFLSIMLKVEVILKKRDDGCEKKLNAVAKCVKNSNEFVKSLFPTAFKNEIRFYKEIVPTLQNFQQERGIEDVLDMFPEFYGARINNNGSDKVDDKAVILLEDLKFDGYINVDRHEGFNLPEAKIILKDICRLHATALGLKFSQTDLFEEKIRKNCKKAIPPPKPSDKEKYGQSLEVFFSILEDYEECRPYISNLKIKFDKMRRAINDFFDKPAREPFATLVHCDLWVNNTMQLFQSGNIKKNKFVDFQLYYYQSPLTDVLFFLWSSVHLNVLKQDFDELLIYYHTEFTDQLRRLNCNTNLFDIDKFWEELDAVAPSNFMDIMYMTMFVVFGKKDRGDELETDEIVRVAKEDVPKAARDKIAFMVSEYGRRKWIEKSE
ncbi:unnamed protein product [Diabrotica balteata]|uniref:CHK kinase-like domain-containing protein n=1 Tax=Diabrotica balteata TaxID=107213 RepID=A0A9N9T3U3_DIABA|nr:unnamed protein product [Diabrotica balteata]